MGRAGVILSDHARIELSIKRLRAAGIENAAREVRWIAESVEGAPDGVEKFEALVARRERREPLQHILGTVEFYGIDFLCDARALIPRADSEAVVEAALASVPEDFSGTLADVGTGSGCLLIAVLSQRPNAKGIGVEASPSAAALAQTNLQRLGLTSRADICLKKWQDWEGWPEADFIISNPPYIETEIIRTLQPEVRDHDPHEALDGGADGLDAYRSIFACGANIKEDCRLVLEVGYDQAESASEVGKNYGFECVQRTADLTGHQRALTFQKHSTK